MEELEISLMQIISYSGEARSLCFEALQSYRDGDKEAGRKPCPFCCVLMIDKPGKFFMCRYNDHLHGRRRRGDESEEK